MHTAERSITIPSPCFRSCEDATSGVCRHHFLERLLPPERDRSARETPPLDHFPGTTHAPARVYELVAFCFPFRSQIMFPLLRFALDELPKISIHNVETLVGARSSAPFCSSGDLNLSGSGREDRGGNASESRDALARVQTSDAARRSTEVGNMQAYTIRPFRSRLARTVRAPSPRSFPHWFHLCWAGWEVRASTPNDG